jgi:very-short-patch-repair endonuclease
MPAEVIRARKLRREMSYPEVLLWQRLRGSPNGVRFRRQHPVGADYTADFYCAAARLVIEVDGEVHSFGEAPGRDAARDEYMRSRGLVVLRVPASEVLKDADGTAAGILRLVGAPLHPRAKGRGGPPPQRAGEDL